MSQPVFSGSDSSLWVSKGCIPLGSKDELSYLEECLGHPIFIQGKCIHCPSPSIEWVVLEVSGRSWPVC